MNLIKDFSTLYKKVMAVVAFASVIFLSFYTTFYKILFLKTFVFYQDSIALVIEQYILWNAILNGHLPLWDPYLNGGQALWPIAELACGPDPVAFAVWGIGKLLHLDALYIFEINCVIWLFIFSLGAMLCSRQIYKNIWINLTVLAIFFMGPFSINIIPFNNGFLLPWRYMPWIIYFFVKFNKEMTTKNLFLMTAVTTFSVTSYQTPYLFFFLFIFLVLYYLFNHIHIKEIKKKFFGCVAFATAIFLVGNSPLIVTYAHIKAELIPLGKIINSDVYWYYKPSLFFSDFFRLSYPNYSGDFRVACAYMGPIVPIVLAIIPFVYFYRFFKRHHKKNSFLLPVEKIWFYLLVIFTLFTIGFFKISYVPLVHNLIRHDGFFMTATLFCISQAFTLTLRTSFQVYKKYTYLISFLVFLTTVVSLLPMVQGKNGYGIYNREEFNANRLYIKDSNIRSLFYREFSKTIDPEPYYAETPFLKKEYVAYMQYMTILPYYPPEYVPLEYGTHFFRSYRYETIIKNVLSRQKLNLVFSVGQPFFEFKSFYVYSPHLQSTIDFLNDMSVADFINLTVLENIQKNSDLDQRIDLKNQEKNKTLDVKVLFSYKYLKNSDSEVIIRFENVKNGFLVFNDAYDPYWMAYDNGKKVSIFVSNGIYKAIFLKPGNHVVKFSYVPWLYIISFFLRIFVYVFLILGVIFFLTNHYVKNKYNKAKTPKTRKNNPALKRVEE